MEVLRLDGVTMEYSDDVRAFNAVDGVSLAIEEGEFVTVVGRSGSGKSTLLNIAAGVLRPTSGKVHLASQDISAMGDRECSRLRNSVIGYIPQGHGLLHSLTVKENILLPHMIAGIKDDLSGRAEELMDSMRVSALSASLPCKLSGGEQRRVSIARALMNSPRLVIADEPTSDLDMENARAVMDILSGISRSGTAVLMVTHETEFAGSGDRRFRMDGGRLMEERY